MIVMYVLYNYYTQQIIRELLVRVCVQCSLLHSKTIKNDPIESELLDFSQSTD